MIRHGETGWNAEGRWQGSQDVPLNARGLEQAAQAAAYVRDAFSPRRVWSSDLMRCTATAAPLGLPVETSKTLREVNYGSWEGKRFVDLPESEQKMALERLAWDPEFRAPGGEKFGNLVRRGARFLAESKVLEEEGDLVIVGHGGALRGLLVALLRLPPRAIGRFHFDNASVSVVQVDEGLATLTALNITVSSNSVANSVRGPR
ncbi:MAG: histidine phosphatase family protein [Chloroflexi bacterium]|nr:histidine phosphatase family protein [Chloroflexota bacterium]